MKIRVTKKHIEVALKSIAGGGYRATRCCPVYQALRPIFDESERISVIQENIILNWTHLPLPEKATKFIYAFDSFTRGMGEIPTPFTFDLAVD